MLIKPDQVIAEARKWIGTRWVHQGRNEFGIDCAGLVVVVHKGLGLPVEDEVGYHRQPSATRFLDHIKKQTEHTMTPVPGAIAVFREANFPCHTGFFATGPEGNMTIIHSYISAKKVVEEPFNYEWPLKLLAVRLMREVAY